MTTQWFWGYYDVTMGLVTIGGNHSNVLRHEVSNSGNHGNVLRHEVSNSQMVPANGGVKHNAPLSPYL